MTSIIWNIKGIRIGLLKTEEAYSKMTIEIMI